MVLPPPSQTSGNITNYGAAYDVHQDLPFTFEKNLGRRISIRNCTKSFTANVT